MRFRTPVPHFFAYVLERVPGAIANLSTCPESGPAFPNKSPRMFVNESGLATGIAMHLAVAQSFLERGLRASVGPRIPGAREDGPVGTFAAVARLCTTAALVLSGLGIRERKGDVR